MPDLWDPGKKRVSHPLDSAGRFKQSVWARERVGVYMGEVLIEVAPLYAKQRKAVFDSARHVFIEASTKSGKTTGCLVWQLDQISKRKGHHWWVAPITLQAKIAFDRAIEMVPDALVKRLDRRLQVIEFRTGSVWSFKSGDRPDNLYGEDIQSGVIDEASRCREEVWTAVRSCTTRPRSPLRVIGNVKGRKNWFYTMCRKAEAGEPGLGYHKLTIFDAVDGGVIHEDEIAEAQRDLTENIFKELYMAEASDYEGNPFGAHHIERAERPNLALGSPVCFGVDLGKAKDWTVLIGLNDSGDVCSFERFQHNWNITSNLISTIVGDIPCLVDSTGLGDPILDALKANDKSNFIGFKFTSSSKQQLMEGLALDLQQSVFQLPSGVLSSELKAFEYKYERGLVKYGAPSGMHDDCVCALALARAQFRKRSEVVWWR